MCCHFNLNYKASTPALITSIANTDIYIRKSIISVVLWGYVDFYILYGGLSGGARLSNVFNCTYFVTF